MEYRPLDITVISASELKNVNMFMEMDVYVVVSLSCENSTKRKTYTDRSGGANPEWNYRIKFSVEESSIYKDFIRFQLKAERSLGNKLIGEVSIPLGDLLDDYNGNNESSHEHEVEYQVRTSSGKARGSFRFSYRFGEKFTQQIQAVAPATNTTTTTATQSIVEVYPPPPSPPKHFSGEFYQQAAMGYTMQPVMVAPQYYVPPGYTYQGYGGYGGGYPPAVVTGYAYPPQPMTYAYMPVQQLRQTEPKSIDNDKKKKSGLGKKTRIWDRRWDIGGIDDVRSRRNVV